MITATDDPIFEVLIYLKSNAVAASAITHARELILVEASDPGIAYYLHDQDVIDEWKARP